MEIMDFETIPDILQNASLEIQRGWSLIKMGELLSVAYKAAEHPVLKGWNGYESQDIFAIDRFDPKNFKRFNRTLVERTIMQTKLYGMEESSYGILTMKSKGIENAIIELESFLFTANKLLKTSDAELREMSGAIHWFLLTDTSAVKVSISYFMEICNNLIELTFKHSITSNRQKIANDVEQVKYLLRQKANLSQHEDQFDEKTFKNIINHIEIELGYHKEVQEYSDIPPRLKEVVSQFFTEKRARISNNKLLLFLTEDKLDDFCSDLSELVMQLFSYHDVGTQKPEKVYHAFLLGVLNSFKEIYRLESNKESGTGRFDILLIPETLQYKGVVIEVKRSLTGEKDKIDVMLDGALLQIVENKYALTLKCAGHNKYIGLAAVFYGKELHLKYRHLITH